MAQQKTGQLTYKNSPKETSKLASRLSRLLCNTAATLATLQQPIEPLSPQPHISNDLCLLCTQDNIKFHFETAQKNAHFPNCQKLQFYIALPNT